MGKYGKFEDETALYNGYQALEQAYGRQGGRIGKLEQDLKSAQEFIEEFRSSGSDTGKVTDDYNTNSGHEMPECLKKFAKDPEKFLAGLVPKLIQNSLFGEGFDFGLKEDEDGSTKPKNLADLIYELKGGINLLHIARTIPEIYDNKFGERVKKTIEEAKKRGDSLSIISAATQVKKDIEAEKAAATKKTTQIKTNEQVKEETTSSQAGEGGTVETSVGETEPTGQKAPEDEIKDSIVEASKGIEDEL